MELRLLSDSYTKDNFINIEDYILSDSGWVVNSANNYNTLDSSVVFTCISISSSSGIIFMDCVFLKANLYICDSSS